MVQRRRDAQQTETQLLAGVAVALVSVEAALRRGEDTDAERRAKAIIALLKAVRDFRDLMQLRRDEETMNRDAKAKSRRPAAEVKAALVRRLDQLLAAADPGRLPEQPEPDGKREPAE